VQMEPSPDADSVLDALTTPLLRLNAQGSVLFANAAMARSLGVSRRRLAGLHAAALEREGNQLATRLAQPQDAPARLRRVGLALPRGGALRLADLWLTRAYDALGLEAHPADGFPGDEPAQLLPWARAASLQGLAHELRKPLLGIKGAAQLLARRVDADARELTGIIESEVQRLATLVDGLLNPAPPQAFTEVNIHAVLERVLRLAESDEI